jgi:hypothetical protein
MNVSRLLSTSILFGVLVACGDKADDTSESSTDSGSGEVDGGATGECVSGSWWTGGNEESPRMHPGMDCIACHEEMHEGPRFTVAGTVFTNVDEPDDCNGVEDIVVEITDADGAVWTDTTNSAGNFSMREDGMVFPVRARVIDGDVVREMSAEIETGACASCHTQDGADGAPGRVMAP